MQNLPYWDLSDLFSSISDPAIDALIKTTAERAKMFQQKYRGNTLSYAKPLELLEALREYESILSDAVKPQAYGELLFTVDSLAPANGAFLQKVKTAAAEIFTELIFFELEISEFPQDLFAQLLQSEDLAQYKHYLEKLLVWKPYRLSEAEERIAEMKDLTGRQALTRLFEQELSQQQFKLEIEGKEMQLTQAEILNLLYTHESQAVRAEVAKVFTQVILQKESVLTFVTNTLAQDKKIADQLHGFAFPEQARHLQNEADPVAVETMAKIVEKRYSLVQEYYAFKKEVLGLEKLYDYDRYAPLNIGERRYSFEQAKEIVLGAFGEFDPSFGAIAKNFFEKNWIDAAPKHGKRGGAYCEGATPEMHPLVFMNFTGSANDVMTLAHELGHAINFELARKQTFLNYNSPLTLAETASIFAETLTFSKLAAETEDKQVLLGLYMKKLEGIFASVHRQTSMYRFEQDLHKAYRAGGELSAPQISQLWRKRQDQMFGDSLTLTQEYDSWWLYIPHFISTPFYVYAYAFGELLALGLFDLAQQQPAEFAQKYKQFLEAGGSQSPTELGQLFGIDLADGKFWEGGMELVGQYLQKAKQLYLER